MSRSDSPLCSDRMPLDLPFGSRRSRSSRRSPARPRDTRVKPSGPDRRLDLLARHRLARADHSVDRRLGGAASCSSSSGGTLRAVLDELPKGHRLAQVAEQHRADQPVVGEHELAVAAAAAVEVEQLLLAVERLRRGPRRRGRRPSPSASSRARRRGTRAGLPDMHRGGHLRLAQQRRPQPVDDPAVLGALADGPAAGRARAQLVVDHHAARRPRCPRCARARRRA